ncbi:MAG TPA: ABC transporter permease [Burkholderiaceae bacterium]|nr:ABC transporter permease [Burkholderiaceae bacterium]
MSLARLAWVYLWSRPLATLLNLLLLGLALAAMSFLLLVGGQVDERLRRDLAGIDLVVGAKGSPMQLILAGVYHLDVPPGNIPVSAIETLRGHPLVAQVVPLSLGDTYRGARIVGTTPDYAGLYGARLAQGRMWQAPLEAVLGSEVARRHRLSSGDRFFGSHGLGAEGEVHGDHPYVVVGVLEPTGTVLDRVVLTSTESVWEVHEAATALDEADRLALAAEREVTMLLVRYRSPLAAVTLPRWVNAQEGLQAAAPAVETARLLAMVGIGVDVLRGFAAVLLAVAGLSVFIALHHAVRERIGDLAMWRMLGAGPRRVAGLVVFEALWLAALGCVAGLALGHGLTALLGWWLDARNSMTVTAWTWPAAQWSVPALALGLALVSAALPAWRAYRVDVTRLLQAPR